MWLDLLWCEWAAGNRVKPGSADWAIPALVCETGGLRHTEETDRTNRYDDILGNLSQLPAWVELGRVDVCDNALACDAGCCFAIYLRRLLILPAGQPVADCSFARARRGWCRHGRSGGGRHLDE